MPSSETEFAAAGAVDSRPEIRGMLLLTTTACPCQKWSVNLFAACVDVLFDQGDFRGPGDQACAAKRSYSAWAALRFLGTGFLLPHVTPPKEASSVGRRGPRICPAHRRRSLSSDCSDDRVLAGRSCRDDPSGSQFQLRGRGRRLVSNGVDGPTQPPVSILAGTHPCRRPGLIEAVFRWPPRLKRCIG